jgi:hypothetical protein
MKHVIDQVASRVPLTVDVVDISTDQQLMDRYGLEIPVLMIGGRKAAKYRVTAGELEQQLKKRGPA